MPAGAGGEKEKWNEELASKHAGAGGEVKPDGEHVGPRGERRGERWRCGVKRKRGQVAPRNVAPSSFRLTCVPQGAGGLVCSTRQSGGLPFGGFA